MEKFNHPSTYRKHYYLTLRIIPQILMAISLIAITLACSSGRKALEQGDYDEAVYKAINRLKSNDNSKKASTTLRNAYAYAIELHQRNISTLKTSADPLKWDKIVGEYQIMDAQFQDLQTCPGCRKHITRPVSVVRELQDARREAAEVRYTLGTQALAMKDRRDKAIEAHEHFLAASTYIPRFKDTEQLMDEALYYAMLRVVVEPIPAPSRNLALKHEFFYNKIMETLHRQNNNRYVQYFTPEETKARELEWVDHVINMEFDRFSLGNLISNTYVEEVSRDSVVIATRNRENIYGTVKAKLAINEKSLVGSGLLDFQVKDLASARVLTQEKFPSEYRWTVRWATYNGDERALSAEQKAMVNVTNFDVPGPQYMFEEFTAPLFDQVVNKIRTYYRNF